MADNSQYGGMPVSGGDIPLTNYGVTDIPANSGVLIDTTAGNPRGIVLPAAAGGVAGTIGVTVDTIKAGKSGRVRVYGSIQMTAKGAITAGNSVQISDTAGFLGQAKVCGAAVTQLGVALNTAADTAPVEVLLAIARNA